ncbi:unnamed protein product [Phytomonas sp. EM1]|nr:unnamed protein product [Phytomonas sp. EM1]|eukprot:CCW59608.1 unnamed protein product [Phytomonas sp. isolate EM1]
MLSSLLGFNLWQKKWPLLSDEEICKHNNRMSLWIVSGNSVYDVTSFLNSHPGGDAILLRCGGGSKNCAEDFALHSQFGQRQWERLKIGEISEASTTKKSIFYGKEYSATDPEEEEEAALC